MRVCVCSGTLCVCLVSCVVWRRLPDCNVVCVCWQAECGAGLGERREEESARRVGRRRVCAACVCVKKKRRARAVGGGDEGMAVEACVCGVGGTIGARECRGETREVRRWRERERRKESSVGSLRVE